MALLSFIIYILCVKGLQGQTTLDDMSILDIINATAQLSEVSFEKLSSNLLKFRAMAMLSNA